MSILNTEALHNFTAVAMAAGATAFIEKAAAGEIDPATPLVEAFGDFPAEFCSIRSALVDSLTDPSDSWRNA